MTDNCSGHETLPYSEELFSVISSGKLSFIYVDIALTVLILLLYAEECHFVIKTYRHASITHKSLWLISVYPVFALTSLLTLLVPRASYICEFVASCFLSICLFQFSALILLYFGNVDNLLAKVRETGFLLKTKKYCVCCPFVPATRKNLNVVRLLIFQTAILQPILQFISAVMWADGKYDSFWIDFEQAYIYLAILKTVSTIIAVYGLNVLHQSTEAHLRTHNTQPKLRVLQLVHFFFFIQELLLSIPARFNKPPCKNGLSSHFQMLEWHYLVLIVEMFLLSLSARVLYRRPMARDSLLEAQAGSVADIYTQGGDLPARGANDPESAPSHVQLDNRTGNAQDNRTGNAQDNRTGNAQDRTGNVPRNTKM